MNRPVLPPAEWHVMEYLWQHNPCTAREAVGYLQNKVGWSRSTILTLLSRMTEKNQIKCHEDGAVRTYSSLISQEEAVLDQTRSFLDRVYQGSLGLMVSAFTKKNPLSDAEIAELQAILDQAKANRDPDGLR